MISRKEFSKSTDIASLQAKRNIADCAKKTLISVLAIAVIATISLVFASHCPELSNKYFNILNAATIITATLAVGGFIGGLAAEIKKDDYQQKLAPKNNFQAISHEKSPEPREKILQSMTG